MRRISDYAFVLTFIWIGIVLGISFLEAPVKFTAPLLTREAGLDVGRHVFAALNKVEAAFFIISVVLTFFSRIHFRSVIYLFIIMAILLLQNFWFMPELSSRVEQYIQGRVPQGAGTHIYYIVSEVIKLIMLFLLGFLQVKNITGNFFLNISRGQLFK